MVQSWAALPQTSIVDTLADGSSALSSFDFWVLGFRRFVVLGVGRGDVVDSCRSKHRRRARCTLVSFETETSRGWRDMENRPTLTIFFSWMVDLPYLLLI